MTATRDWRAFAQQYGLLFSFLVLCVALSLVSDRFLNPDNLLNILRQSTINGIIAVGMMMVILTRGIDLSVGSILALSTIMAADMLQQGWNAYAAAGFCLLVGGVLGLLNGFLVSRFAIPPFIATLGMMTFARGLALSYSEGQPITGLAADFRQWGTGFLGPIPLPIVVAAVIFLLGYVLLNHTPLGRYIFALGDNERAAFFTGLPTKNILLFVYVLSGALAALAGVILIGRLNSAQPTAGLGYEFDAIAAVVIGGTSFDGGEGTIFGTLIGVLIIAVLSNGLNLLDVPSPFQDVAKGAVIALALLIYRALR
ncbi:MAG: ribose ABC transporter permease [Chloroflexi bacterium]|nr:ribose ABC transporter permease [Chloroflexota bacterium]